MNAVPRGAPKIVYPLMTHKVRADRDSLTLGYAGVYSSFLLHAKRAAEKYGLDPERVEDLRHSNLAHLLAISGLHMGLLTVRFWSRVVPISRSGRTQRRSA